MSMRKCLIASGLLLAIARVGAVDYLTAGADPQRTGWIRDESVFTTANVSSMKLLWKVKLESTPREMHNLFPPLVVERVTTARGAREILVVPGVSDDLFGLDAATGEMFWSRHFDSASDPANGAPPGTLCPGGQTAIPVIAPGATPGTYVAHALSWDGRLRHVNVSDGSDAAPPEKFAPPNGKPYALNLVNGVIYTTLAQGCGGWPNAFLSYDLATKRTSAFLPQGGGLWGRRGAAIDPEGRVYMGTGDNPYIAERKNLGNAIVSVKLDANLQLQHENHYAPQNANWLFKRDLDMNVSPLAVDYRGRKFLMATSKECRVWLLDRDNLGGADHRTELHRTPLICNDKAALDAAGVWGSMAAWQDASGTQWLLVPFWGPVSQTFHAPIEYGRPVRGGVAAFKLEERNGGWTLTPAWLSRDIDMAEEVLVANGIVFTYGSGEDTRQQGIERAFDEPPPSAPAVPGVTGQSSRRINASTHATLYALDALTGKELWSSGDQITSFNHFSGLTVANGRVYLPTYDGYLYCFGIKS
jgi:outer membrane protein assembly factor BamB